MTCKYCDYDYSVFQVTDDNNLITIDIYKDNLLRVGISTFVDFTHKDSKLVSLRAKVPIKYCPMCGKKLY